jgi:ferredoxin
MPLTDRGREILSRLPATHARSSGSIGCEIVRHEDLCIGCGTCARNCPVDAIEALPPEAPAAAPDDAGAGAETTP